MRWRVIHYSAEGGRFEAVVFTQDFDDELEAVEFMDPDVAERPGFKVDFDEKIDFPLDFAPSDGDMYVKVGL